MKTAGQDKPNLTVNTASIYSTSSVPALFSLNTCNIYTHFPLSSITWSLFFYFVIFWGLWVVRMENSNRINMKGHNTYLYMFIKRDILAAGEYDYDVAPTFLLYHVSRSDPCIIPSQSRWPHARQHADLTWSWVRDVPSFPLSNHLFPISPIPFQYEKKKTSWG